MNLVQVFRICPLNSVLSPSTFYVVSFHVFSPLQTKQPLCLHILTTICLAKECLPVLNISSWKVSLLLIGSDCIMCIVLRGSYLSDCPYMGMEALPIFEIHDLRVRMGSLPWYKNWRLLWNQELDAESHCT